MGTKMATYQNDCPSQPISESMTKKATYKHACKEQPGKSSSAVHHDLLLRDQRRDLNEKLCHILTDVALELQNHAVLGIANDDAVRLEGLLQGFHDLVEVYRKRPAAL